MPTALLWLTPAADCAPAPPDRTYISDAAQDGTGQVWGAWRSMAGSLYHWKSNHWQNVRFLFAEGYYAAAVASGPDGRVYCVWQDEFKPGSLLSVHDGNDSRLLARFPGAFERTTGGGGEDIPPRIFPEAGGGAWVMGQRSVLWHIGLDGHVRSYPIPTAWFYPKRTPQIGNDYYLPTLSAVDGRGRRWFWSANMAGDSSSACLHGVLIWDGRTLTPHPTLTGVPDKPITVIVLLDTGYVWLSEYPAGLYQVDTQTLQGRRVTPPERGAFQCVEQIFRAKNDWYLTDWATTTDERSVVLWREHTGQWEKMAPGLDAGADQSDQQDRSWLAAPSGLWLGAFGGGAWWLPDDGKAISVDWQRGFPLSSVRRLFRLRDGRLLAITYNASIILPLEPAPLLPAPGIPIRTFLTDSTLSDFSADANRHLWGLLAADSRLLSEWNGRSWRKYPIPKNIALDEMLLYAWDTRGRLWLLPGDHTGPAAIFDPKTRAWASFASCEDAYAAQIGIPGFALHTDFRQPMARFGSGGRVCFVSGEYYVHFFDGHLWKKWKIGTIVGQTDESQGVAVSDGPPFFNRAGLLCLNRGKLSYVWTADAGWRCAGYEVGPDDSSQSSPYAPPVPPGSPVPRPDSIISDGPQSVWLTYDRQLYRVAFGLSAPQFAPGTAQPFLDGRGLAGVLHDSRGNLFFNTGGEYVMLPAREAPVTHLNVTLIGAGGARLTLGTQTAGKPRFVWRLDGGAWSAPMGMNRVLLDFLPGGPHTFEAIALDERLSFNPAPAHISFTVHADPNAQVHALINTLMTGDDAARETAVAHLVQFPALAPSALKAARSTATEDARWWIDAALQQIGDLKQAGD